MEWNLFLLQSLISKYKADVTSSFQDAEKMTAELQTAVSKSELNRLRNFFKHLRALCP